MQDIVDDNQMMEGGHLLDAMSLAAFAAQDDYRKDRRHRKEFVRKQTAIAHNVVIFYIDEKPDEIDAAQERLKDLVSQRFLDITELEAKGYTDAHSPIFMMSAAVGQYEESDRVDVMDNGAQWKAKVFKVRRLCMLAVEEQHMKFVCVLVYV